MSSKAKKRTEQSSADKALLVVCARFLVYFVIAGIVITLVSLRQGWQPLQLLTAKVSTALILLTGQTATLSGTLIWLSNRTLSIDQACTGINIIALFCALVLAYPVKPRYRLLGIAVGVPLILVINVARIVAVARISIAAPSAFTFVHDYLFQVGMALVVAAVWAAWLSLGRRYAG